MTITRKCDAGLVYRDGRPASSQALAGREQEACTDMKYPACSCLPVPETVRLLGSRVTVANLAFTCASLFPDQLGCPHCLPSRQRSSCWQAKFLREGVWVVKIQPPLDAHGPAVPKWARSLTITGQGGVSAYPDFLVFCRHQLNLYSIWSSLGCRVLLLCLLAFRDKVSSDSAGGIGRDLSCKPLHFLHGSKDRNFCCCMSGSWFALVVRISAITVLVRFRVRPFQACPPSVAAIPSDSSRSLRTAGRITPTTLLLSEPRPERIWEATVSQLLDLSPQVLNPTCFPKYCLMCSDSCKSGGINRNSQKDNILQWNNCCAQAYDSIIQIGCP